MMRNAVCALVLLAGAAAAEDKPAVKEIDLNNLKVKFSEDGKVTAPAEIKSADDLKKNDALKDAAEAVAKKVDFGKEKLVLFRWSGSGGDKIVPDAKTAGTFEVKPGLTFDLRQHARLFAVPKDAEVKVVVGQPGK
jgi:hypothetical protein